MREERIPKKMLHMKLEGKRLRPQAKWIDQIRKDIKKRGKNWEEI
jgi:hypothetical protein